MIGLDTNVLLRYFLRDDPGQADRAAREIQRGERFFIGSIVLCELAWVLQTGYGLSREELAEALGRIFATAQFEIEDKDLALAALDDFRASKADFADCLIGRRNRSAGCDETLTFDRSLRTVEGFTVLA